MAKTQPRGTQILDGSIGRDDLDVSTVGKSVIRKVVAGNDIDISADGADSGTGDVTINAKSSVALLAGDGVDGALVFDGSSTVTLVNGSLAPTAGVYTMVRDIYATTLVVQNGATLKPAGYKIHASVSATVDTGGIIPNEGNPGAATAGGAASASGTLGGGFAGGTGSNGAGAVGGGNLVHGMGGSGGGGGGSSTTAAGSAGGAGGNSDGWVTKAGGTAGGAGVGGTAGGAGGIALQLAFRGTFHSMLSLAQGYVINSVGTIAVLLGGSGGGSGGGITAGAQGGGGGGGGGLVWICSPVIVNNGSISVKGGNGVSANGNGGAGGGGGGGVVALLGRSITQGSINIAGGTGGAAATNGKAGGNGGNGLVLALAV